MKNTKDTPNKLSNGDSFEDVPMFEILDEHGEIRANSLED